MKNRIWRNWKISGTALIMTCFILMGNGRTAFGAESEVYEEQTGSLTESEQEVEVAETEEKMEETTKSDLEEPEILVEAENDSLLKSAEPEQEPELTADPDVTELPEDSSVTVPPSSEGQEKTELDPGYRLWIEPEQEQIKAGRELLYTVRVENTGNCRLSNILLQASFSDSALKGEWEEAQGAEIQDETLKFDMLDTGIKKEFYFSVQIPEEQSGKIELHLTGSAEYEDEKAQEFRNLTLEENSETEVLPLKADFQVTKTADRTMAVPGDHVIFQICIRNTGERTLHSVVTTEKFQLENVPVRFLEAEGVVLNKSRTKARIEKINPESSVGLLAEVTLPEDLKDQKLVNEVIVTTLETGEKKVTSKAELQVYKAASTPTAMPDASYDEGAAEPHAETQSKAVSTHPKTGDPMKPALWLLMIPGSLLAAGWVRSRQR